MDFEDFIISPRNFKTESWQIGNRITKDIREDSIVLLFVSDYRGAGGDAEVQDFTAVRKEFYKLSQMDFEIPVVDLGDLVSGNLFRIPIISYRKCCRHVIIKEPFR